jgi:protein gp37
VGGTCPNDGSILRGDIGIDWAIVGGESGPGARPMHPDWARSLRDQCKAAGTPFFFKQWGEWAPVSFADLASEELESEELKGRIGGFADQPMYRLGKKRAGRLLDGCEWNEVPHD